MDNWVPVVVAVVSLLGIVTTSVVNLLSNNRREIKLITLQQQHEQKMTQQAYANAQMTRATELKEAAYFELLRQVSIAADETQNGEGVYSPTEFWLAASKVKLVTSAVGRTDVVRILDEFSWGNYTGAANVESELLSVFERESNR